MDENCEQPLKQPEGTLVAGRGTDYQKMLPFSLRSDTSQMIIAPSVRFADRLTAREAEVVDLAVLGLKNDEIAENLGIASRTVEVHRLHAMRKLQVEGICQLMWLALTGREAPATWTEAYFREVDTDGEQG